MQLHPRLPLGSMQPVRPGGEGPVIGNRGLFDVDGDGVGYLCLYGEDVPRISELAEARGLPIGA